MANYLEPGRIELLSRGWLLIGKPHGSRDAATRDLAAVLDDALPTTVTGNITGAHWTKLIVNLNNALGAVTGYDSSQVLSDNYLPQVGTALMREGLHVVQRADANLSDIPDVSARQLQLLGWLPLPVATWLATRKARGYGIQGRLLGSTLQSLERHKPTEIDYLNGEIVRLGLEVGVPTPLNSLAVQLVHEVERSGMFFDPQVVAAEFHRTGL